MDPRKYPLWMNWSRSVNFGNMPPNNFIQRQSWFEVATDWRGQLCENDAAATMAYRNLQRQHPGLQKLLLQEIFAIQQKSHGLTSSHPPNSSWEMLPDFCDFNSSYPYVDYFKASRNDFQTSTPNCVNDSGFYEGSLFKGYSQGVASAIIARDRCMKGIKQVASETNTSPGQISSITGCSDGDGVSGCEPFDNGSTFPGSSLQYISEPSLENHIKLQRNNHGYKRDGQGVASTITASDRCMNDIRQVASEMNTSPGQISSITVSSDGDGVSESEPFDDGSIFPGSSSQYISEPSSENHIKLKMIDHDFVQNNHNFDRMSFLSMSGGNADSPCPMKMISQNESQSISKASYNLHKEMFNTPISTKECSSSQLQSSGSQQFDHLPQQPFLQVGEKSQSRSNLFSAVKDECNNQITEQEPFKAHQLPQQFHGVQHVASITSALDFGPKDAANLGDSSSPSVQNFLLLYIKYKSMSVLSNSQVPFLNHIHNTVCDNHQCNCNMYSILVSHFDNCHNSKCSICASVRRLRATGKVYIESGEQKNDLSGAFCNREANGASTDNIVEVLPPLKRQKMDNSISNSIVPSINQSREPDRLPHLEQWHEAALYSGDVTEVNKELLSPTEDRTVNIVNNCNVIDYPLNRDLKDTILFLEELIVSEISNDVVDTYQGLFSDGVPENSEEPTSSHMVEDIEISSKPDQTNLKEKCDLLASAADFEVSMKSSELKLQGVSLADYFTAGEMKEHLRSFGQLIGQEVRGNMKHSFGENICQLCAMDRLEFVLATMYCSNCGVPIKHNLIYYRAPVEMGIQHCFCTSCYRGFHGGIISFHGDNIPKTKLQKKKNNEKNAESWVQCDKCECWQHQICALYNDKRDPGGKADYICPKCWLEELENGEREPLPKSAAFGAKDLPSTMLSDHIENRLFKRLKQERERMANDSIKKLDEVPGEADLAVRVVLSVNKKLEVKQQFLDIFNGGNYPSEFLYRSKVILLFQRIERVDVCLFGMYVQEYGSECGRPNQRCVYISYLDSVKYLRPETKTVTGEALRTFVYHEILIGYLDYCKKRGFSTCYIWACPPLKGEDYILYCHPESQRTPKAEKLRQWYESMLKKAAKENIVVDCTSFYDYFFIPSGDCNTKITAARLPYFDGDYWSSTAEYIIRDFEQEGGGGLQRKVKKQMTKRTLKSMGYSTLSSDATKDVLVMQTLGEKILPVKDNFIVVHLQFACMCCHEAILSGVRWFCNKCKKFNLCSRCLHAEQNLDGKKTHRSNNGEEHLLSEVAVCDLPPDTEDNDVISNSDLFENRHSFLSFCQGNHYQFDTLRRAKHSSMMLLYHLHKSISTNDSSPPVTALGEKLTHM